MSAAPILPDASQFGQPFIGGLSLSNGVDRGAAVALGATANSANKLTNQIERQNYLSQREQERLDDKTDAERRRLAAKAERRDEATKDALNQQWYLRFDTKLLQTSAAASDAVKGNPDPATQLSSYDEAWAPVKAEIDAIVPSEDDPNRRDRAELQYTRHYLAGRERILNTVASSTATSVRADVSTMEDGYRLAVEDGSMNPVIAAQAHEASVRGFVGTAYTPEQADSLISHFDSLVATTHANGFIQAGDIPGLKTWLSTDFARTNIDQQARFRMVDAAEKQKDAADKQQVRTLIEEGRNASSAPPTQDENHPIAWSDELVAQAIDRNDISVKAIMDLPGAKQPGAIVDGRVASEEDVRMALFGKSLQAAAAKGDGRAFDVLSASLGDSPEATILVKQQEAVLQSVDRGLKAKRQRIDDITGVVASGGEPTQAFLSREAVDGYAKQQLSAGVPVAAVASDLARYGTSVPQSLITEIDAGFQPQATPRDMAMSLAAIDAYSSVDPSAGLRVASSMTKPALARIVASMPFATPQEKAEAVAATQLLVSPQGQEAIGVAKNMMEAGADSKTGEDQFKPITAQDSVMAASNNEMDFSVAAMPRNAQQMWEGRFTIELARLGVSSGTSVELLDSSARTASERAANYVLDHFDKVPIGRHVGFLSSVGGGFFGTSLVVNPHGTVEYDRSTLVDSRFFNLDKDEIPAFSKHLSSVMNLNTVSTQKTEMRPDMALVQDVTIDGAPRQMTLLPIIAGRTPVAYATWDAVTGTPGPTLTNGLDFERAATRTINFNPVEDMDPDRQWRRKPSEQASWMANSETLGPRLVDSFEQTMIFRYDELAEHDLTREEYLDAMARSLGWRGWTDPNAAEKRSKPK